MASTTLSIFDPSLQPKAGQQAVIDFRGRRFSGTVLKALHRELEIRVQAPTALAQLHPDTHVRVEITLPRGACELVLTRVRVFADDGSEGILRGHMVGNPVHVQRRAWPRVAIQLDAGLVWPDISSPNWFLADARTENLSLGGALLRFPDKPTSLPAQNHVALLSLRVAAARARNISVAVRIVHAWHEGARLRMVDVSPETREQLRNLLS